MSRHRKPVDKEAIAKRLEDYREQRASTPNSEPPPFPLEYEEITGVIDLALGTVESIGDHVARAAEDATEKLESIPPDALSDPAKP
jgi:hypothetical protein